MKKFYSILPVSLLAITYLLSLSAYAQTAPHAEPVYGGHVEHIDAYSVSSSTTMVFASVFSPNSMFYTTIHNVNTTTPTYSSWNVVPDLDASAGYGVLKNFAVEENSGYIFASTMAGDFVATSTTAGSLYTISHDAMVEAIEAYDSRVFFEVSKAPEEWMFIFDIDGSGNIVAIDSTLIDTYPGWNNEFPIEIHVNPYNNYVYLYIPGYPPTIYKSSDTYDMLSNSTTWSYISTSSIAILNRDYVSMGIAPDGRLYAGSYEGNTSGYTAVISYTDTDGDPWTTNSISEDCGRGAISVGENIAGDYIVHFSRIVSNDDGTTWNYSGGADGSLICDPNNGDFAYVRTDWGIGMYDNLTGSVTEINYGLQAVQVYDWTQNQTKDTAWVASKSGIWNVSGYGGSSPSWSNPIWPQYHTVPWTDVECATYADPVYCGNNDGDVYFWTNSNGTFNNHYNYDMLFEARNDASYPYYTWTYSTYVSGLAIDENSTNNRVFVGLYDMEDWDETTESLGAVFVGEDTGSGWTFSQCWSTSFPSHGIDINDVVCVQESGNTTVYAGVEHNTTYGTVTGIYRFEETAPLTWNISADLYTTYALSATIYDLYVTPEDTIYACGSDAAGSNAVIYRKAVGDVTWDVMGISGLPSGDPAKAITTDVSTHDVYVAVNNTIYVAYGGSSPWSIIYTYPPGTEINCIYYDDLLAGTSFGLFLHSTSVGMDENNYNPHYINVYPNPFTDYTNIEFTLYRSSTMNFDIYDINGKLVNRLVNNVFDKGNYSIVWNGYNFSGKNYHVEYTFIQQSSITSASMVNLS
jgi:hypothetical protein